MPQRQHAGNATVEPVDTTAGAMAAAAPGSCTAAGIVDGRSPLSERSWTGTAGVEADEVADSELVGTASSMDALEWART